MPGDNGSGTYVRFHDWTDDKAALTAVTASRMDTETDGIATALTNRICKDGQSTTSARIPFASGVSAPAGSLSAAPYAQTGNLNTGVYFPATNEVAFAAAGSQILKATTTAITFSTNIVGPATTFAFTLGANPDATGGGYVQCYGSTHATPNRVVLGNSGGARLIVESAGGITIGGAIDLAGNLAINTNKFNVTAASGNTTVAGTLGVTGTTTTAALNGTAITASGALSGATVTASGALSGATAVGAMVATQAQMEAVDSAEILVTPFRQHFHPGHSKAWCYVTVSGGTPTLQTGYNVTSITDNGVGDFTVVFTTAFSSGNFGVAITSDGDAQIGYVVTRATTDCRIRIKNLSNALVDPAAFNVVFHGDM